MSTTAETRREEILKAARTIINTQGVQHLTADAVAKAVGVSRPLLYHYFTNINDLISVVINEYVEDYNAALDNWKKTYSDHGQATLEQMTVLVSTLRKYLFDACPLRCTKEDYVLGGTYFEFLGRCASLTADRFVKRLGLDTEPVDASKIDFVGQRIYFIIMGFAGMLDTYPDMSDEDVAETFQLLLTPVVSKFEEDIQNPTAPRTNQNETPTQHKTGFFNRFFGQRD